MDEKLDDVLAAVGPRLKALRLRRDVTLTALAAATGISVSTLSRLESGQRRPNLELLLPLAQAHQVPLDELVGAPATGDPRVHLRPITAHGMTIIPLTRKPGGIQAYKHIVPAGPVEEPNPQVHEGYEWLYVLNGKLRMVLAGPGPGPGGGRSSGIRYPGAALVRPGRRPGRGVPEPVRLPRRAHAHPGPSCGRKIPRT